MKKIIVILICVLLLSALIPSALADNVPTMTITASKETVNPGETVTFTVHVTKVESCTSAGVILSFDDSVYEMSSWECLSENQIMLSYDPATKLLSFANQGKDLEGNILKFTLTVTKEAKIGKTTVSGTPHLRNTAGTVAATLKAASVTISCKHSYDNGCDTTCNDCGATRTAQHNWDGGKTTKDPSCTETGSKQFTCTVCGETKTETTKATGHAYSNNCDTSCNTCGEKRSITHNYSTKWSSDGTQHWHACTVCGDKKDVQAHTPGAAATADKPQTCTVCSFVLQPALGHTHQFGQDWKSDVIGHWHECATCEEIKDVENHVYDSDCDSVCDVCGYIRAAEHMYVEQFASDSDGHWHECAICGDQLEKEAHVPGPEATTQTPQICIVCGFELTPMVGHTHEYTWKFDGESHWQQCTCGHTVGETTDHIWDDGVVTKEPTADQSGIMTYTCVCGEQHTKQIPATGTAEPSVPSDTQQDAQEQTGAVTVPGWLILAACVGVAALCALFLILGMFIGRKQAERY